MSGSEGAGGVDYGIDAETAGLTPYCNPEAAMFLSAKTCSNGSDGLAVAMA